MCGLRTEIKSREEGRQLHQREQQWDNLACSHLGNQIKICLSKACNELSCSSHSQVRMTSVPAFYRAMHPDVPEITLSIEPLNCLSPIKFFELYILLQPDMTEVSFG